MGASEALRLYTAACCQNVTALDPKKKSTGDTPLDLAKQNRHLSEGHEAATRALIEAGAQ